MLTQAQVQRYSTESGLRDIMIAEKEVVLTFLLQLLSERGILDRMAFKGGTSLRKMFLGNQGRFSTDLDFTGIEEHDHEDVILAMMDAFQRPFHGIQFSIPDEGYYETQDGLSWGVNPTYVHEWNQADSEIKLQISRRETPTLPTERHAQIEQSYFRFLPFVPAELVCLALPEILAEKIRACFQRNKARDIYDLSMFATRPLDHALIRRLVVLKLWQARDRFDPARLMHKFADGRDFDWDDLGQLHIDADGALTYQSTYHLRSNDYYSSRNYASRLIGSKLIFYSPLYLNLWGGDPFDSFPAVRRWHRGATQGEFRRIVPATRIYRPEKAIDDAYDTALHTVTICDLASGNFDCNATSVIGPAGRVFYVSPQAVYVWVTGWVYEGQKARSNSMLYRMPLDGTGPSAVGVSGSPIDQFSFLESEDSYVNVLVRTGSAGDGMWSAEGKTAGTALLRMPLASFSDGTQSIPASSYQKLPNPKGYDLQDRFVGDYLLYGSGSGWWYPQKKNPSDLYAVRWTDSSVHKITLSHGIDRIEEMGDAAVVVGTDGTDLHFSAVSLSNSPEEMFDYVRKGASQGELRSHGFFYKPEDEHTGMLGLPISLPGRPGYGHLFQESSAILFLRNDKLRFQDVGELKANPEKAKDDRCRASCVDWYGNSQPLFVHGRVVALLGYELVEGTFENGQIQEKRRINYGPQSLAAEFRTNH